MFKKRLCTLLFFVTLFPFFGTTYSAEKKEDRILVIANLSVPENTLTQKELRSIFLGEKSLWSDKQKISFALIKNTNIHHAFLESYIDKTVNQYKNHWKKLIFTGRGRNPTFFENEEQIIDYVSKVKGAIGYIPASKMNSDKVKKINIQY